MDGDVPLTTVVRRLQVTQPLVRWAWLAVFGVVLVGLLSPLVSIASAEQASSGVRSAQGGYIDAGEEHTCAILADRSVRCWGKGVAGRLGYGNDSNVLAPAAAGPVNLGPGRDARAIVAGDFHTCAILDDGTVRCWGFGENGRLAAWQIPLLKKVANETVSAMIIVISSSGSVKPRSSFRRRFSMPCPGRRSWRRTNTRIRWRPCRRCTRRTRC